MCAKSALRQKQVAGSQADPAPRRCLDMFQQKTGVLVDPQIEREIVLSAADLAEPRQPFEGLPVPEGTVLGEEIIAANLVGDTEPPREGDVPRPANQRNVIRRKGF